jgi:membrane associated rhomboid family serine protease
VHLKGWVLLIVIFTMEIAGLLSRRKITIGKAEIDHLGHLGGFCTGVVSGWWCKTNQAEEKARQRKELAWYEKLIGKKPNP